MQDRAKSYLLSRCVRGIATVATAAMVFGGLAAPAAADDSTVCEKQSGDVAIAACTRVIESGRVKGHSLAIHYYNPEGWQHRKAQSKIQHRHRLAFSGIRTCH